MGADYYIYTEYKDKKSNRWKPLNGQFFDEKLGAYKLGPTYVNGSRTYFARTYDFLRSAGYVVDIKDVSPEILESENWVSSENTIIAASLTSLKNALQPIANRKECCGYVNKSVIWDHVANGSEIDEWLTAQEYNELSDAEKKIYEFLEWDDSTSWPIHVRDIVNLVVAQKHFYYEINYDDLNDEEIRIVCFVSY